MSRTFMEALAARQEAFARKHSTLRRLGAEGLSVHLCETHEYLGTDPNDKHLAIEIADHCADCYLSEVSG